MDRKTVEHIANLARLAITEQEADTYARQMSQILDHFEQLSKIDTSGVEPLVTASPISPRAREDVVAPGLGAEKLLENAPDKLGGYFKVPTVV